MASRERARQHHRFDPRALAAGAGLEERDDIPVLPSSFNHDRTRNLISTNKNRVSRTLLDKVQGMLDVSFEQSNDFGKEDRGVLLVRQLGPVFNYLKRYSEKHIPANDIIRHFVAEYGVPQDVSEGYMLYRSGELLGGKGEEFINDTLHKFKDGVDMKMIILVNKWSAQKTRKLFLFLTYKTYGLEEYNRVLALPTTIKLAPLPKRKKGR